MDSQAAATFLTVREVAECLRMTPRRLMEWLRAHPHDHHGEPFYSPMGRTKTFDESDIARIRAAARDEERCRLGSSHRIAARGRSGRSTGRVSASPLTEALALASERRPRGSSS
jgi:hypothetical protein